MMLSDRPDTAWCVIDGVAVGLDIAADRYFRLDEAQNAQFLANASPEWLDRPHQPTSFPLPDDWERPQTRSAAINEGSFRLGDVARSLWIQRRIERRLTTRTFVQVLRGVRDTIGCRTAKDIVQSKQAQRDIRAFQHARLLRTAADRCLPRSIALALCLARNGCRAHVVLGVKLAPFAAHCWTQNRGEVLNDELEEVRRYTPILVL